MPLLSQVCMSSTYHGHRVRCDGSDQKAGFLKRIVGYEAGFGWHDLSERGRWYGSINLTVPLPTSATGSGTAQH